MVHRNVLTPTPKFVTPLVGEVGVVTVPEPDTNDQIPVAGEIAAVAFMVCVLLGKHFTASDPAFAPGWLVLNMVTVTSSLGAMPPGLHGPLLTVHLYTFAPTLIPVTTAVGLFEGVNVPDPEITVHWPVPGEVTALPLIVAESGKAGLKHNC